MKYRNGTSKGTKHVGRQNYQPGFAENDKTVWYMDWHIDVMEW
jgi:hypothetical protein